MRSEDWIPGPDFRKGFLRIPLQVWLDVYCRAPLTRRQLQIVSVVIRESWGWATRRGYVQLWTRPLSTRHFADLTGLTTDHLRRDLNLLVRRRVLLQDRQRYRFVSDSRLWKTLEPPPLSGWDIPSEQRSEAAESAPHSPELKKVKKEERNVPASLWNELSPGGDNSPDDHPHPDDRADSVAPRATSVSSPSSPEPHSEASLPPAPAADLSARVVDVVAAFVGSLPPDLAEALRRWICDDGIAAVWRQIEPQLRDPVTARIALERLLRRRGSRPEGGPEEDSEG